MATSPPTEVPVRETIRQLEARGYRDGFCADGEALRATMAGRLYSPEELRIDAIERFEGPSNPDDEAIVFALRAPDGLKGTFTVAYGPAMDARDARLVERLGQSAA